MSSKKQWIATRTLSSDSGGEVEVGLGAPEEVSPGEWRCAYRIARDGSDIVRHAHGIDAFQALMMALAAIRSALDEMSARLQWQGGEPGDTGFPRLVPQYHGLEFSRRIDAMIDLEVEQLAARAKRRAQRKAKQRP